MLSCGNWLKFWEEHAQILQVSRRGSNVRSSIETVHRYACPYLLSIFDSDLSCQGIEKLADGAFDHDENYNVTHMYVILPQAWFDPNQVANKIAAETYIQILWATCKRKRCPDYLTYTPCKHPGTERKLVVVIKNYIWCAIQNHTKQYHFKNRRWQFPRHSQPTSPVRFCRSKEYYLIVQNYAYVTYSHLDSNKLTEIDFLTLRGLYNLTTL